MHEKEYIMAKHTGIRSIRYNAVAMVESDNAVAMVNNFSIKRGKDPYVNAIARKTFPLVGLKSSFQFICSSVNYLVKDG
jgi:hypothetical protein